jgi:septal ring factor EnvC (AmiA/AmiB activator)
MKAVLFASLLVLAVLPMCKPDATNHTATTTAESPASPAAVRAQFDILRDSADVHWTRMMASDDKKLADLRELLQDLSKYPDANQAQLAGLRAARARLPQQRYTRQTMASSPLIDRYDTAQDSVLKIVLPIAAPDGNAPSERVRDYVEAIQLADANVVGYRAHYDAAAKAYNNYLQVHRDELNKLGGKYANLQPLPLFELGQ